MAELIEFYHPAPKMAPVTKAEPEPESEERASAKQIFDDCLTLPDLDEVVVVMRDKSGTLSLRSNSDDLAHSEQLLNRMLWVIANTQWYAPDNPNQPSAS